MNLPELMTTDPEVNDIVHDDTISRRIAVNRLAALGHTVSEWAIRDARKKERIRTGQKLAVVIGDYQVGCHDRAFIHRQCEMIKDLRPDTIISTGDELDATSLGRWVRGLPEEFETTLQDELDMWYEIASWINEAAPNAEKRMCRSNHTDRLPISLRARLPGLRDLRALQLPALMRLDELGWTYDNPPGSATEFLPGVTYSHGDEWSITSHSQANKAREIVKHRATHVVFGHSHQAGLYTQALGYNFNSEVKWAMNVGTGMAFDRADYIKHGSPNWSRGIGIIYYDGNDAHPELVLDLGGKMRWNGRSY